MPDELLTPQPLPDGHTEILRLLEPRLTLFECYLRHLGDGRYNLVSTSDGRVLEDLHEFALANGIRREGVD